MTLVPPSAAAMMVAQAGSMMGGSFLGLAARLVAELVDAEEPDNQVGEDHRDESELHEPVAGLGDVQRGDRGPVHDDAGGHEQQGWLLDEPPSGRGRYCCD